MENEEQVWDLLQDVGKKGIEAPHISNNRIGYFYILPKYSKKGQQILMLRINDLGRAIDFYRLDANKFTNEVLFRLSGARPYEIKSPSANIFTGIKIHQECDKVWQIAYDLKNKQFILIDVKEGKGHWYDKQTGDYLGQENIDLDKFQGISTYLITSHFNLTVEGDDKGRIKTTITSFPEGPAGPGYSSASSALGLPNGIFGDVHDYFAKHAMGEDIDSKELKEMTQDVVSNIRIHHLKVEDISDSILNEIKDIIKANAPPYHKNILLDLVKRKPVINVKFKIDDLERTPVERKVAVKIKIVDYGKARGFKRIRKGRPLSVIPVWMKDKENLSLWLLFTKAYIEENRTHPNIIAQDIIYEFLHLLGLTHLEAVLEESRYNSRATKGKLLSDSSQRIIHDALRDKDFDYLFKLLNPWDAEESKSVKILKEKKLKGVYGLIFMAEMLSYEVSREAAIAILASGEIERIAKIETMLRAHHAAHLISENREILEMMQKLNISFDFILEVASEWMSFQSAYIRVYDIPVILNMLTKNKFKDKHDFLHSILYIYSKGVSITLGPGIPSETTFLRQYQIISKLEKEVILTSLKIALYSEDKEVKDIAQKFLDMIDKSVSSSPLNSENVNRIYWFSITNPNYPKPAMIPVAIEGGRTVYEVGMDEVCIIIKPKNTELIKTIGINDCIGVVFEGIQGEQTVISLAHITQDNYSSLPEFTKGILASQKIKFTHALISFREDKKESIKELGKRLENMGIKILLHRTRQLLESTGIKVDYRNITLTTSKENAEIERLNLTWQELFSRTKSTSGSSPIESNSQQLPDYAQKLIEELKQAFFELDLVAYTKFIHDKEHGLEHGKEVVKKAEELIWKEYVRKERAAEVGPDFDVVFAAALLHDLANEDPERHHINSARLAVKILNHLKWDKRKIAQVAAAIYSHRGRSFYQGIKMILPKTLEAQIVHDADTLVGLENLRRIVTYGRKRNRPFYKDCWQRTRLRYLEKGISAKDLRRVDTLTYLIYYLIHYTSPQGFFTYTAKELMEKERPFPRVKEGIRRIIESEYPYNKKMQEKIWSTVEKIIRSDKLIRRIGLCPKKILMSNVSSPTQFISLIEPSLVRSLPIKLGVHFKSFSDGEIVRALPVNMIEIKPDKFPKEEKLFLWDEKNGRFIECENNLEILSSFLKENNLYLQIHFPQGEIDTIEGEKEIWSIGDIDSHSKLIKYFEFLEIVRKKYKLADEIVITLHPPLELLNKKFKEITEEYNLEGIDSNFDISDEKKKEIEERILRNANNFLVQLGEKIISNKWGMKIGVENQASSARDSWNVGYSVRHFEIMLENTPESIQLTFDIGHRLLSEESLTFQELAEFAKKQGKYFVNIHFHENEGWKNDPQRSTYRQDLHRFPSRDNVPGYEYYIMRTAVEKVPLTLEVNIKTEGLKELVGKLWKEINNFSASSGIVGMNFEQNHSSTSSPLPVRNGLNLSQGVAASPIEDFSHLRGAKEVENIGEFIWGKTITGDKLKEMLENIYGQNLPDDIKYQEAQQLILKIIKNTCGIKEDDHPTKPQFSLLKDIIYPSTPEAQNAHIKEYILRYPETITEIYNLAFQIKKALERKRIKLTPLKPVFEGIVRLYVEYITDIAPDEEMQRFKDGLLNMREGKLKEPQKKITFIAGDRKTSFEIVVSPPVKWRNEGNILYLFNPDTKKELWIIFYPKSFTGEKHSYFEIGFIGKEGEFKFIKYRILPDKLQNKFQRIIEKERFSLRDFSLKRTRRVSYAIDTNNSLINLPDILGRERVLNEYWREKTTSSSLIFDSNQQSAIVEGVENQPPSHLVGARGVIKTSSSLQVERFDSNKLLVFKQLDRGRIPYYLEVIKGADLSENLRNNFLNAISKEKNSPLWVKDAIGVLKKDTNLGDFYFVFDRDTPVAYIKVVGKNIWEIYKLKNTPFKGVAKEAFSYIFYQHIQRGDDYIKLIQVENKYIEELFKHPNLYNYVSFILQPEGVNIKLTTRGMEEFIKIVNAEKYLYLKIKEGGKETIERDERTSSPAGTRFLFLIMVSSEYGPYFGQWVLGSYLKEKGIEVDYFPLESNGLYLNWKEEALKNKLHSFQPNFIGITAMGGETIFDVLRLRERIKEIFPSAYLILGGSLVNSLRQETLEKLGFDFVIRGYGEETLLTLIEVVGEKQKGDSFSHQERESLKSIPGLMSIIEGKTIKDNFERTPIMQPLKGYPWNMDILSLFDNNTISLVVSRGCSGRCIFCRPQDKRIYSLKEEEFLKRLEKFKNSTIDFVDDDFFIALRESESKQFLEKLKEISQKNNIRIVGFHSRINYLNKQDREFFSLIKELRASVWAGAENFNNEELNYLGKKHNSENIFSLVDKAKETEISLGFYIILTTAITTPFTLMDNLAKIKNSLLKYPSLNLRVYLTTFIYPKHREFDLLRGNLKNEPPSFYQIIPTVFLSGREESDEGSLFPLQEDFIMGKVIPSYFVILKWLFFIIATDIPLPFGLSEKKKQIYIISKYIDKFGEILNQEREVLENKKDGERESLQALLKRIENDNYDITEDNHPFALLITNLFRYWRNYHSQENENIKLYLKNVLKYLVERRLSHLNDPDYDNMIHKAQNLISSSPFYIQYFYRIINGASKPLKNQPFSHLVGARRQFLSSSSLDNGLLVKYQKLEKFYRELEIPRYKICSDGSEFFPTPFEAIPGIIREIKNNTSLKNLKGKKLLEIGAGDLRVSLYFHYIEGMSVVAVEKDERVFKRAEEVLNKAEKSAFIDEEKFSLINACALDDKINWDDKDLIYFFYTQPSGNYCCPFQGGMSINTEENIAKEFRRRLEKKAETGKNTLFTFLFTETQLMAGLDNFHRLESLSRPLEVLPGDRFYLKIYGASSSLEEEKDIIQILEEMRLLFYYAQIKHPSSARYIIKIDENKFLYMLGVLKDKDDIYFIVYFKEPFRKYLDIFSYLPFEIILKTKKGLKIMPQHSSPVVIINPSSGYFFLPRSFSSLSTGEYRFSFIGYTLLVYNYIINLMAEDFYILRESEDEFNNFFKFLEGKENFKGITFLLKNTLNFYGKDKKEVILFILSQQLFGKEDIICSGFERKPPIQHINLKPYLSHLSYKDNNFAYGNSLITSDFIKRERDSLRNAINYNLIDFESLLANPTKDHRYHPYIIPYIIAYHFLYFSFKEKEVYQKGIEYLKKLTSYKDEDIKKLSENILMILGEKKY